MSLSAILASIALVVAGPMGQLQRQIDAQLEALGTLVIQEDIDRYSGAGNKVQRIDSLRSVAEVVDGVERYSRMLRNGREVAPEDVSGTWSFGELATLLRTTREALSLPGLQLSPESAVFQVAASRRRWFVSIDSRIYWLDFAGEISMSSNGQLRAIRWTSRQLPASTGVDHIVWSVSFRESQFGGHAYVLPEGAEYRVIHRCSNFQSAKAAKNLKVDWNITRFEVLGRYGSEVAVDYAR